MIYRTSFHVGYVPSFNIYQKEFQNLKDSKFYLNSHPIQNLFTFESEYIEKFCNSYPHLSLETVFPALKLTHTYCINMNISFFEN